MAKARLLFVGTDDGLVMFSDPGASGRWLRIGHELRGNQITAVWSLFENPQVVLAGGAGGMWRSSDGGASWQRIGNQAVLAFYGEKATPETVEVLTNTTEWLQSNDGGRNWHAAATRESTSATNQIELAGKTPVYLRAEGKAIRRSENGTDWAETSIEEPWSGEVSALSTAGYHIDTAFAGSTSGQLATSSDRGRTWHVVKRDLPAIRFIVATRLA